MQKQLLILISCSFSLFIKGQNPVLIPDTISGSVINLALQEGTHEFFPGFQTNTMGVNGNILGPTVILEKGQQVTLHVENQLQEETTLHWHGLHVSSENDGGPHTVINPGETWSPAFTVLDNASTYWYHPHLHHKTNEHVSKGISGFIIVKDQEEAGIVLPRNYGTDDFPLVIQTRDFDDDKEIVFHSNSDDILMVNATLDPFISVPAQIVRLRLLNGSSMRTFNLGFTNNQPFYQIGSDGGLLESPVQLTRLLLSPGERAEVLIDLSSQLGDIIHLKSFASELPNGIYGAANPGMGPGMVLTGYHPNPLNGTDFNVLQISVGPATVNPVISIPAQLVNLNPFLVTDADTARTFTFHPEIMGPNQLNGHFMINDQMYDMDVINEVIPLDNVEIWTLTNQSGIAHPFHIHMVQFYILDRNGVPPPLNESGRKDVVLVKPQETVRIITKFENFSNEEIPYMYHCHMLMHEDEGMMGQFLVIDESPALGTYAGEASVRVFPNPSKGNYHLQFRENLLVYDLKVIDRYGRIHHEIEYNTLNDQLILNIHGAGGFYMIQMNTGAGFYVFKVIKE
ncbi:MAG: multicopper oxidase domain-containing protein [Bacteroidales bacterium]